MHDDDDAWFSPKRFGYGSGLPLRWQGWAVLAAYCAVLIGAMTLLRQSPLAQLSVMAPATILMMIICARTTRGGWRWRWGEDE